MSNPWLSIIIPTYNGEDYLPSALDSIIIQEDHDIECIVIDDGSTDTTLSILEIYKKELPMKILQCERRRNWVASTNRGLSLAKGEYACFLHQDDLWLPNRLHIMKKIIKDYPTVDLFLHSSIFIDSKNNVLGLWRCPLPVFPVTTDSRLMIEKLLIQNFISIPAPIFKRTTALKVGEMDETLWYTADWDFWLKIASCGDALYYPKPLSAFRIHPGSQTIVGSSHTQNFREQLESVANKHLSHWEAPDPIKKEVGKIIFFSNRVNSTLAGTLHGEKYDFWGLLSSFLLLGPLGWRRYLRDSRIWERTVARLRARLTIKA
jgi:glycosyltransferase involved in cell wall biosynthesis